MAPPNADPPVPGTGDSESSDNLDIEARFAEIVRELDDVPTTTGHDEPVPEERAEAKGPDSFPAAPWVRAAGPRDWPTTPEVEALEEAGSHFTPPDPPLVLGHDPLVNVAWVLVIGIPIAALLLVMFLRPFPTVVGQVGAGAFVAGLTLLIWRMPRHRAPDDHDPGAVV